MRTIRSALRPLAPHLHERFNLAALFVVLMLPAFVVWLGSVRDGSGDPSRVAGSFVLDLLFSTVIVVALSVTMRLMANGQRNAGQLVLLIFGVFTQIPMKGLVDFVMR